MLNNVLNKKKKTHQEIRNHNNPIIITLPETVQDFKVKLGCDYCKLQTL